MEIHEWCVNNTLRGLTALLCRIDAPDLQQVPARGPLIIVANHVNFLEIPLVLTRLRPRPITGLVKAETWSNPFMALLFNLWGGIPVRRGEADVDALRRSLAALEKGHILAVAPEGTRSGDGRLQIGHPGVVMLALRSHAPILPVAYYGGERFKHNLPRLRRTDFRIRIGRPFLLDTRGEKVTGDLRRKIVDEIMYQVATLLPEEYRGYYHNMDHSSSDYLQFIHRKHIHIG
jgi:1-acyl-sn-glycerol-3-phosphate acyltransferase